jgi:benzylsuccinate CoA-transferase BbsF subunit
LLEYEATGKEPDRIGNSSPYAAPHGVYRCKGDDRWCTIGVSTDAEWASLCRETGRPELMNDLRFNTLENRKNNEEALNNIVSEWTAGFSPEEVMAHLQKAGVPAGMVSNAADVLNDPQLRERNIFWTMRHAEMGDFTHLGQSFQLSETPARPYSSAPLLGEHTEQICTEILGMTDDEFVTLMQEGVFE